MRLSCDPDDPGYPNWLALRRAGLAIAIALDGEIVGNATTADAVAGFVLRNKRDPASGDYLIENGEYVPERLTGKLEIRLVALCDQSPDNPGRPIITATEAIDAALGLGALP